MADAAYHKITQELAESRDFPIGSSDSEEEPFHELDMGDEDSLSKGATPKSSTYERLGPDSAAPPKSFSKQTTGIVIALVVTAIVILAIVFAVVPRANFPHDDIRLPQTVEPESYEIVLHPNLTTEDYTGHVNIQVLAKTETQSLFLHMKSLSLSGIPEVRPAVTKRDTVVSKISVTKTTLNDKFEMLYIALAQKLSVGERYILTLHFEGKLSEGLNGFYKSRYKTAAGEDRLIATTHFEPTSARKAFPCFDEPAMKANFTMTMIRDKDHITLFNMPLTSSEPYEDTDLMMDKFDTTVKMSTYLVAFIVCDFDYKESITSSGVKVRVYAPHEQISEAIFSAEAGANVLSHYEEFFNVRYPLPKQDMVAIPDFSAGAMENWGLITYRLTSILYEEGVSSEHDLQWVATVIAHELAHQWFGNLVTMEWWNDLWLNEGFASFVEYIGVDFIKPEWQMMDQFLYLTLQRALALDALSTSHPILVPVYNPDEINELFDSISYDKGASIIRMLEEFLTRDVFMKGITDYLQTHEYGNAETDDLWEALTKADKENGGSTNVKEIMDTWTLQMGYPFVTLARDGNKVTATQQRFLINPTSQYSDDESPFNYKWNIPFTYITSSDPEKSTRLPLMSEPGEFDVPAETTWFKGNVKSTGFYRVNYDDNSWDVIIQQLQDDHTVFTSADRTSFIDDIFHLARAKHVRQIKALDLSLYLSNEEEYVPIATAIADLKYIGGILEGRDGYKDFKKYMLKLFDGIINTVGWKDVGSHIERYRRSVVLGLADYYDHESTIKLTVQSFDNWLSGTDVSPDLKPIVYCSGVRNGGEEEFNAVWEKYQEASVPTEIRKLLSALSCTKDEDLLQRLLESSLDDTKIRTQDADSVIISVANNEHNGQNIAWQFFKDNWDELTKRYAGESFTMGKLIKGVISGFNTEEQLQEVRQFFDDHSDAGSGTRSIQQGIEIIEMNIDWLQNHEDDVTNWFKNNV
ncbi:endoplasmic reticulum aminopeptidase 2-like [Glandiceps talaboti]